MRVNIDEIKDQGVEREWDLTRDDVDEAVSGDRAGYRASGPAHVTARLEKAGRRVHLAARTRADLTVPCGRCLVPVAVQAPVRFDLNLLPADEEEAPEGERRDRGEGRAEGSFAAAHADDETYRGKVIDLDPLVREQLALALPAYPVCRDDCRGLCAACGQNLNEKECGCDRHVPDPRWAGLEKLRKRP
jgi:uncharacterized protein